MTRLALLAACLSFAVSARAAAASDAPAEIQRAAEQGLRSFASIGAVPADGSLGRPFPLYRARLDTLAAYAPETAPEPTLTDLKQFLVPVYVRGRAAGLMQLAVLHGSWRAVAYGQARAAEALQAVLDERGAERRYALIDAPAIFVMLVEDVGDKTAASVYDDRRLGVKAGEFLPLPRMFARLALVARRTAPDVPDSAPRP